MLVVRMTERMSFIVDHGEVFCKATEEKRLLLVPITCGATDTGLHLLVGRGCSCASTMRWRCPLSHAESSQYREPRLYVFANTTMVLHPSMFHGGYRSETTVTVAPNFCTSARLAVLRVSGRSRRCAGCGLFSMFLMRWANHNNNSVTLKL
jgi:hypothetical protein